MMPPQMIPGPGQNHPPQGLNMQQGQQMAPPQMMQHPQQQQQQQHAHIAKLTNSIYNLMKFVRSFVYMKV